MSDGIKDGVTVPPNINDGDDRLTVNAKLVICYDDEGNYLIHGDSKGTGPEAMFKTMQQLWNLNPEKETVRYFEVPISLPRVSAQQKVKVYRQDD